MKCASNRCSGGLPYGENEGEQDPPCAALDCDRPHIMRRSLRGGPASPPEYFSQSFVAEQTAASMRAARNTTTDCYSLHSRNSQRYSGTARACRDESTCSTGETLDLLAFRQEITGSGGLEEPARDELIEIAEAELLSELQRRGQANRLECVSTGLLSANGSRSRPTSRYSLRLYRRSFLRAASAYSWLW